MRPISLHLQNVRTFDSLDFTFPGGCCAITGPNGAGKTTLISALDVALFGAESRSLADWLSKDRPDATMTILLVFEHYGETYRVRRTFSGKGRGQSKFDLEAYSRAHDGEFDEGWIPLTRESAAATQEELERIIGLNRQVFRMSAYFGQKDRSLCDLQPREAKQVLFDTLGLEVWDGYRERARTELSDARLALAGVRAKIESAETELAESEGLSLGLRQAQEREKTARASLEDCGSQLVKARERLSKLREAAGLREAAERATRAATQAQAGLVERIASLRWTIEEAEERLAERAGLEVLAEGLPGLIRERDALAEQEQGFAEGVRLVAERARLYDEISDLVAGVHELAAKAVSAAENVSDEICETCHRPLDSESVEAVVATYKGRALTLGAEAKEKTERAQALTERIEKLPAEPPDRERAAHVHDLIQQGQNAQQRLAALAEVEASRGRAAEELQKVRAELPEREETLASARATLQALGPHDPGEVEAADYQVRSFEQEEHSLRGDISGLEKEIARLDERLQRLDRISADLVGLNENLDSLRSEVELLSHLERACGPNGVPALILETSAIPQLEAEWNRLLRLLPTDSGDLFEVELHTQRERKAGGAVDALDVIVYANGLARPYSTYSGGEQMRISIAQRRALSNLLAHRRDADCPLMILDEPNSLDDSGMAALARVLEDLARAEDLTILVVSHDPALRDAFEQSVTVSKVDGRSRVETADGAAIIPAVKVEA